MKQMTFADAEYAGKRTQVKEPMFPNYMFIELDPERIHTTTVQ